MKQKNEALLKKAFVPSLFMLGGALAGYLYYRFFGCTNGCAVTSSPYITVLYGAVMGLLISVITKREK